MHLVVIDIDTNQSFHPRGELIFWPKVIPMEKIQ